VTEADAGASPPRVYLGGLDGLRAVAVIGVLAYHAGVAGVGGGLLGVDVFFVLSGFLITTLLVAERQRRGSISLSRFWCRRARRLLPALLIMLTLVAWCGRWFGVDSLSQLRGDALSTLLYVANWHYVLANQSYFVHFGAPSPLLHTWSLAVEEQFYLVWPLVAVLALRRWGGRGLAAVAGSGVVVSAGLTAALYAAGTNVSRLYYGTDTRAQELMVGCLLALVVPRMRARVTASAPARRALAGAGLAGAGVLAWALHAVGGQGSFLYDGGFLVVALATAAVVAVAACRPDGPGARALAVPPLRYIGRISYGLYVYHWPLFLILDHAHTGLVGVPLLAVRLVVTLVVAALSFHLVEEPIRSGRFIVGHQGRVVAPLAAGAAAAMLLATTVPAAASVPASASARQLLGPAPAAAAPPAGTPPVRMLLVGDSMGMTLADGLARGASGWGVQVVDQAALGCDLAPDSTVNIMGQVTRAAQGCPDWENQWARLVARDNPDVVGVALGRWEVSDRIVDGRWTTVGNPVWDARLSALLEKAVTVLSSRGARVVLFTLPYVLQNTEQPDGQPWPINIPARTDVFNGIVRRAAAALPRRASVVDLNKLLDPAGRYTNVIDGITVRSSDEEHISPAGGEMLRSTILPVVERLGVAHARLRTGA
jgi:peptidoglycan/LPS O-acetylase OafA/YrhL